MAANHPTAANPYAGLSEAEASRVSHAVAAGVIAELRRIRQEQKGAPHDLGLDEKKEAPTSGFAGAGRSAAP